MKTEEFIAEMRRQSVFLYLEGGNIRVVAPPNRLLPEMKADILKRKPEIIAFLRAAAAAKSSESFRVSPLLVAIRHNGSKPPIFAVPGLEGFSPEWEFLARELAPDQPMYGLESVGLDGHATPLNRVEPIATNFVREIRTVRCAGPYCLLASCGGGNIAFEMAQQLHAAGNEVRLAFVESWPPHFTGPPQPGRPVAKANFEAITHYVPRHYPGSLLLIMAEERAIPGKDARLWWAEQASQSEVVRLPGRDLPGMFQNSGMIAAHLCRYFGSAQLSASCTTETSG